MSAENPFLCDGCPAKGIQNIDADLPGYRAVFWIDSFRQARKYKIMDVRAGYMQDDEATAQNSAQALRYWDAEAGDFYEIRGDVDASRLGVGCANQFLNGECPKTEDQILFESDID